jgi:hypothetical protein
VQLTGKANFPGVPKPTAAAWRKAVAQAKRTHAGLVKTVAVTESCLRGADRPPEESEKNCPILHHCLKITATAATIIANPTAWFHFTGCLR